MKNNGEISPPFLRDLRSSDFVRSRKIVKISESELAHNGLLTPTQNGFIIHLRSNLERKKKRTVVAHELGHTFFYNMSLEPPVQFISDQHSVLDNWAVEGAAFEIGRQILIPSDWLDSVKRRESLEIFFSLIEKFDVTRDILARRLFHNLDLWEGVLFFSPIQGSEVLPPKKQLFKSNKFKAFQIKDHFAAISDWIIQNAVNKGEIVRGLITLKRTQYLIEASRFGNPPMFSCLLKRDN